MKTAEITDIRDRYERSNRNKLTVLAVSAAVMAMLGIFFVTIGVTDTNIVQVAKAVAAWAGGSLDTGTSAQNAAYKIIVLMRLPRVVLAVIAGIGLSVSGVAMQSVTRNPLVSPFTMGISSASAFGASMCIVFGSGMFFKSELGIISCAFASAVVCITIVYAISTKAGMGPETVVLTGIALNYSFSALTSTI